MRVLLPLPLPEPFDYAAPEGLELAPGDQVIVPLSGRDVRGVVWAVAADPEDRELRLVVAKVGTAPLPAETRAFVDWVARYTCQPPGAVLRMALRGAPLAPEAATETVYALPDPAEGPPPARLPPGRRAVLDAVANAAPDLLTAADLVRVSGASAAVVKGLAATGRLTAVVRPVERHPTPPDPSRPGRDLTPGQERAAQNLIEAVCAPGGGVALLDGVTGSGKTEVYLEAVARALAQDPRAQVLVLLPEIALTQAILTRFTDRFGSAPVEWHSEIGDSPRRRAWTWVATGRARIVVGARSALFLPFQNLRLIVVDEEHDGSYKQDEGVTYHARDMAVVRARLSESGLVLASATPSVETLVNATRGRYAHVVLPHRPGLSVLPSIDTIDLRLERPAKDHWISPPLVAAVSDTLARREQALLFLNRRGYAPLVICFGCGQRMKAPDTDSWLVEHRYTGRLVCHRTGFSMPKPAACPHCGAADALRPIGPGVERLEEEARRLWPAARTEVFSSDTATSPAKVRDLVGRMAAGEIDLLIGTQIVAKGHNFPRLTLVGVVDADLGLKGDDLRAGERTYQILVQVAGRAGRADRPGRALLQTCMPEHEAIEALVAGDRDTFLGIEIEGRKLARLPPFGRLALLHFAGPDEAQTEAAAQEAGRRAPLTDGVDVLGPAEPPIGVVRGRFRRRFLIRADLGVDLSAYMAAWLARLRPPAAVRVGVDVEPYSFL